MLRRGSARHHARVLPLAAALAVLGASAACTGDAPSVQPAHSAVAASPDTARAAPGTVVQPGRPGEPTKTLPPDATVAQARWNAADAAFVRMMIPHHAQALRMCALARTRADDPQVAAVARRIDAAQSPEILALASWLQAHGLEGGGAQHMQGMHHMHGGMHEMQGMKGMHGRHQARMPGMLSPAQMRELASANGDRFDRLFLADMIGHHRGAVTMAGQVGTSGSDLRLGEIAAEVATEQRAEISRMRAIRDQL